uniref:Uncharacterized protein n=1 Tax=Virgibacillus oceani TaxID=1479511 RepID=A0A917HGN7_9BACI|nr:hypothetical protein GCM10011398_24870 [Virgibacillus oceani]
MFRSFFNKSESNFPIQEDGFLEEGRKIKEFKLNDGEYIDDIIMYKFV